MLIAHKKIAKFVEYIYIFLIKIYYTGKKLFHKIFLFIEMEILLIINIYFDCLAFVSVSVSPLRTSAFPMCTFGPDLASLPN